MLERLNKKICRRTRMVGVFPNPDFYLMGYAEARLVFRVELTDGEWERLRPYFPERQAGDKGRPRKNSRQILNGILWIARSGAAWRDLPERYGAWQTVYKRFVQWQEVGLLACIFHDLGADADLQDISIDSNYIKAHKASAGAAKKGKANPKTNAKTNVSK